MRVWVNVWGRATRRHLAAAAFAPLLFGCIDDFDDPKGYGPRDETTDTFDDSGERCTELCRESASCGGGIDGGACRGQCNELIQISRRGGCTEDFEELVDCLAGLGNACTQQDACSQAAFHFGVCIQSHCDTHPSDCPF